MTNSHAWFLVYHTSVFLSDVSTGFICFLHASAYSLQYYFVMELAPMPEEEVHKSGRHRLVLGLVGTCESFFCVRIESRIESAIRFDFESNWPYIPRKP